MFKIGEFAVCPGHGVGQIHEIEERDIDGESRSYYILKLVSNGMKVMIPVDSKEGIRALASENEISDVYRLLADHDVSIDNSTWNRRYREYMEKIKTGSLLEIADVLRSLFLLRHKKNLSFGEKKMLDQCKNLLVQEISLSLGNEKDVVMTRIDSIFR